MWACSLQLQSASVKISRVCWFARRVRIWSFLNGAVIVRGLASMEQQSITFPSEHRLGDGRGVLIGDAKVHRCGLIVVHEWWGMNEQIKNQGAEIARDGALTVLVPDMYRGKLAIDKEEAGHLMGELDWDGAVRDISGAAKYLMSLGCGKVGVTGFCMGGALSFCAAVRCPEISAAAPFYGIPRENIAHVDLTKIRVPVQAHFGEFDDIAGFSSPAEFRPLSERLTAAGAPYQLFTYPAGHAFANPSNPNYNADVTAQAFHRLFDFMKKNLQ